MLIHSLKLKNFRCYTDDAFSFDKLNIILGKNGVGKSTISLDGVLFALYGYSEQPLKDLVQKRKKKCTVELEIIKGKDIFIIKRSYPTALSIKQNNKLLTFNSNREGQNFINQTFGDRDNFLKFRTIDKDSGVNILELGKTGLRKTLLSVNEGFFNSIRERLNTKKRERETLNKDTAQVYSHYPSQTRLSLLNAKIKQVSSEIQGLQGDINVLNNYLRDLSSKKGSNENSKGYYKVQKQKIYEKNDCPFCERPLDEDTKNKLLKDINQRLVTLNNKIERVQSETQEQSEALNCVRSLRDKQQDKRNKINRLITRLDSRLRTKKYVYTDEDVLLIKKAIQELDSFYSYFIREWVSVLEPVINNVTEKIGFAVEFIVDEKGSFDVQLTKDGDKYTYKNLSTGQRLVLNIAFKLAILMDKGRTGIVICDEGFSSLDNENLNHIFSLFENFPFQLIAVLHRKISYNNLKTIDLNEGKNNEI